jgi:LPS export ABC transporter permease LptF
MPTRILHYWKPRKIDLYVFAEVFRPFLAGIVFFAFIFMMFQLLKLAEFFIVHGVPLSQLAKILMYIVITFLPLGLPIAMLVGVLVAFSRFSTDSEIVAMKASGMSMNRIAVPVFLLSLLVSTFAVNLNMNWAPWAETTMRGLLIKVGNSKFTSSIQAGTFTNGFLNLLLYTEKSNNRAGKMENVFIFDERDPKNPLTIISKTGEVIRVKENDEVSGAVLQLQDGTIHQSSHETDRYHRINFGTYQIYVDLLAGAPGLAYKPKMFLFNELIDRRNAAPEASPQRDQFDTELWRRISVFFMPIFFVWMGMGFGTVRARRSRAGVFIVAILTMGIYWQLQVSCIWMGDNGKIAPWLALEIPNFLVGIVGWISFRRASW